MTHGLKSLCTLLVASSALAACGTAGVTLSSTVPPIEEPGAAKSLLASADAKAVVVSVPISKIMIKVSSAESSSSQARSDNPPEGTTAPQDVTLSVTHTHRATGGRGGHNPPHASGHSNQSRTAQTDKSGSGKTQKSDGDTQTPSTTVVTQTVIVKGVTYSVSIVPEEDPTTTFRATPVNNFWSSNNFGVSKVANSDVPTAVTNEFTDETVSRITAIESLTTGAVAAAGKGLLLSYSTGGAQQNPATPSCGTANLKDSVIVGDVAHLTNTWQKDPNDDCWSYGFLGVDPPKHQADTLKRALFQQVVAQGSAVKAWPVPSCLDVKLVLARSPTAPTAQEDGTDADVIVPLRIIDPGYVRMVGIPDKGKIAMHPICDADVTDSATDRWATVFDALTALETQSKAIKDGQKKH